MVERTVVLSTFLLFAISVFAQNPVPQQRNRLDDLAIRGKLIMASGRDSDQRIEVKLEKSTMQPIQTTYTDSAGGFEFRNLAPGSYYISITLEGYEAVRQQVEVMNSFGNASVTIFLNKPAVDTRSRSTGLDAEDRDVIDISQMKENLPKKAVQDYEKALDEKKKGKIESAIKLLQEAIRVAPNFYHAHNNLGLLYQSLKRYMDAETEYKRSRELNAKTERPLINLGSLYIEQAELQKDNAELTGQMLDQALDALEAAVKLNPRSASAYYLLGSANYKSSFLEEAEAAFKKAYYFDPSLSRVHLVLANIYVREGKWQDVIGSLDAYLKENPKAPDRARIEEMRAKFLQEHEQ